MEDFYKSDFKSKITKYPGVSAKLAMDFVVENASVTDVLLAMVPVDQIFIILCFIIYSLVSIDVIAFTIPLFVFHVAVAVMITSTMQMFRAKRKTKTMKKIKLWSDFLARYHSNEQRVPMDDIDSRFTWKSMAPYWTYFISMIITVLSFSMADKHWIPCSELSVVSFFFACCCFTALSDHEDHYVFVAMALEFISNISSLIDHVPENHWFSDILEFLIKSWYKVELYEGTYIDISIPSVAYLLIGLTFVQLAMHNSGCGIYRRLIPHLVCFFWWQTGVMLYKYATWWGFARACIGWITLLLLLPLFFVFVLCLLGYYSWYMLSNKLFLRYATTIALVAIPSLVIFGCFKLSTVNWSKLSKRAKLILSASAAVLVISAISGGTIYALSEEDLDDTKEVKYVDYDMYEQLCGQPAWDKSNVADIKIKCAHFAGYKVHWHGKVEGIDVQIENGVKKILDSFPAGIAEWFKCAYGQKYVPCSKENNVDPEKLVYCKARSLQYRACHVQNQNSYKFKLNIKLQSWTGQSCLLVAGDNFKDYVLSLRLNDEISFRATMKYNIGGDVPTLQLTHIHSETTHDDVTEEESSLSETLEKAFEFMSNFLLFPLIVHT